MIVDHANTFQRNPEVLQDVCSHRVEMANFVMSCCSSSHTDEDRAYYQSQIRHYRLYDV